MNVAPLAKTVKSFVKAWLPRGLNLGPPIAQLFLNDGRDTRISLVNFPAFLAPRQAGGYSYRIEIYDQDGRALDSARIDTPGFAAKEVHLNSVFGSRLPTYGMVTARIEPRSPLSLRDRHLGRIRPHFFVLYSSDLSNSFGLVHPQTSLGAATDPHRRWLSNLQLDPAVVQRVEVFQINPSDQAIESEAFVESTDGVVLARERAHIPAHGTRRCEFDFSPFVGRSSVVSIGLHGLAAGNGKPILFMHFRDGSFTCCHG